MLYNVKRALEEEAAMMLGTLGHHTVVAVVRSQGDSPIPSIAPSDHTAPGRNSKLGCGGDAFECTGDVKVDVLRGLGLPVPAADPYDSNGISLA